MDLDHLQRSILTLATMEQTDAPVISCYLNLESGEPGYRPVLDERVRCLRSGLAANARQQLDDALVPVEASLRAGAEPGTKGLALFSRAGDRPFFLSLGFQVPLPNWIAMDSTPNIYHLVELKDTYHRYVVLLATENVIRILGVNLGSITKELWNNRPELRKRVGREWTKEHYQAHRRERFHQFLNEQIRILSRVMAAGGYRHLILAGDARATASIRKALPRHLEASLIDIVHAPGSDRASDVVAATLAAFVDQEERESQAVARRLCAQMQTHGLAVAGARASLRALAEWQVDVLVLAKEYEPGPGWACSACETRDFGPSAPKFCPRCGARHIRAFRTVEEMVRLAEQRGALVEVVNESPELMRLGGVGCLLRYLDRQEYAGRAA